MLSDTLSAPPVIRCNDLLSGHERRTSDDFFFNCRRHNFWLYCSTAFYRDSRSSQTPATNPKGVGLIVTFQPLAVNKFSNNLSIVSRGTID